ncbi:urease accessory protein UreH domain-containing protein [Micromonospora sp. KLBMP9576]|uniref:urease accessory protein UreH domain-containing protein n=1 Tax=Micromonospora sp. KLBMP9576 TaxID=3424769 RepID=UPI003D93AFA9
MITTVLLGAALAAHPLTPFSVDQIVELTLHKDRVDVSAVLDIGEVPTKQITPDCTAFASHLDTRVDGHALRWTVQSQRLERLGAPGVETSRLTCQLSAPAELSTSATVSAVNNYLPDRVGANQVVLVGKGVALPANMPGYERSAEVSVQSGTDASRSAPSSAPDRGWLQRGEDWLARALGDPNPLVLVLAVLMAMLLGAAHAALPGHGKTVMALYLAGRQGRRRDAVIVGGTVTLTHTSGVLILGIATTALAGLAAESVLKWLGMASGALVAVVGIGMLINALRHRRAHRHDHHGHHHHHHHQHDTKSLTLLGIAGGLVPSPTALVVLLGAAALGRLWLGIILIFLYGLGMAATLTAAGLLLLRIRDRWNWLGRLTVPAEVTGSVIIALGFGLAARATFAF